MIEAGFQESAEGIMQAIGEAISDDDAFTGAPLEPRQGRWSLICVVRVFGN